MCLSPFIDRHGEMRTPNTKNPWWFGAEEVTFDRATFAYPMRPSRQVLQDRPGPGAEHRLNGPPASGAMHFARSIGFGFGNTALNAVLVVFGFKNGLSW